MKVMRIISVFLLTLILASSAGAANTVTVVSSTVSNEKLVNVAFDGTSNFDMATLYPNGCYLRAVHWIGTGSARIRTGSVTGAIIGGTDQMSLSLGIPFHSAFFCSPFVKGSEVGSGTILIFHVKQ